MNDNETSAEPVLFERAGPHVALVTLNRPQRHNAINAETARCMNALWQRIDADDALRVAILTGAGERSFCAGADLIEAAQGVDSLAAGGEGGWAGFVRAPRKKPWIAAVRGAALGGGTELALACDMIVAGHNARFGLPEVTRGIIAGGGGCHRLPRAIPAAIARELLLTGAAITAERALALGLVNRVTGDGDVLAEAVRLAESVAANAPLAVLQSLGIARMSMERSDEELHDLSMQTQRELLASADFQEGVAAFRERRAPSWRGR